MRPLWEHNQQAAPSKLSQFVSCTKVFCCLSSWLTLHSGTNCHFTMYCKFWHFQTMLQITPFLGQTSTWLKSRWKIWKHVYTSFPILKPQNSKTYVDDSLEVSHKNLVFIRFCLKVYNPVRFQGLYLWLPCTILQPAELSWDRSSLPIKRFLHSYFNKKKAIITISYEWHWLDCFCWVTPDETTTSMLRKS